MRYTIPRILPCTILGETPVTSTCYDTPEKLATFWEEVVAREKDHNPEVETLAVVIYNARLHVKAWARVSTGTLNETSAHMREIFKPVILRSGYALGALHNHPSGDPSPSAADLRFTRQLKESADLLGFHLTDHVIVTDPRHAIPGRQPWYSFREAGCI